MIGTVLCTGAKITFGTVTGGVAGPNIRGPAKLAVEKRVSPKPPANTAAVSRRLIMGKPPNFQSLAVTQGAL